MSVDVTKMPKLGFGMMRLPEKDGELDAYRGFFGCKHFSKTNEFLVANGLEPIDWQIENI